MLCSRLCPGLCQRFNQRCIQWTLMILCIILWIFGVGLLALIGYLLVHEDIKFKGLTGNKVVDINLLAVIAFLFLIGSLGFFGAKQAKPIMLKFFFGFMLFFLLAQLGLVIYITAKEQKVETFVRDKWNKLGDNLRISIQRKFSCCGMSSQDKLSHKSYLDASCFVDRKTNTRHGDCFAAVKQWAKDNVIIVGGCAAGLGMLEIVILVVTKIYLHQLKKKPHGIPLLSVEGKHGKSADPENQTNNVTIGSLNAGSVTNSVSGGKDVQTGEKITIGK